MQFDMTPASALFSLSVIAAIYVMGGCLCRIRHPSSQIKHSWKIIYVLILGLAGWALCDLTQGNYTLFCQAVCIAIAAYFYLTKDAWLSGPPVIAKTPTPAPVDSYERYRPFIKTGDMIGIATGTLGGRIIQLGQVIAGLPRSYITHIAIAQWVGTRLMGIEMAPSGYIVIPLSQYVG